jgi:hypothetical protein
MLLYVQLLDPIAVTSQVFPLTDVTQLLEIVHQHIQIPVHSIKSQAVINQALLDSSQVSVGTSIFTETLEVALAENVFTGTQFLQILNVAFHIVGCPVKSQYFQLVATLHRLGVQLKSQYFQEVATSDKSQVLA